jgi:acyl carrier protein
MCVLELIMFLEERYGLKVPDEDALPENLDSVDRIVGYVQRRSGAVGAGAAGADARVA